MPIPFACPHCQLETLVDDEFAGQSGACAGCGKPIAVPYIGDAKSLENDEVVVGIPRRRRQSVASIALMVVGAIVAGAAALSIAMALLFPAVATVMSAEKKHRCQTNLQQIADALQQYERENGSLPPAYVVDESGKPMYSWRVLILKYLDDSGLYHEFDKGQPWDSPHNVKLTKRMPPVFACPADPSALSMGESNYMVIVGPETLFPGATPRSTAEITDDIHTTIAVVETPAKGVVWTQPSDLAAEKMQFVINGEFGKEMGSQHLEGVNVLMADGQVRFLSDLLPADYLSGMSTIQGSEAVPLDAIDSFGRW